MKKIVTFPPIGKFFNELTNTSCTPKDYQFGIDVYKSFNCKNLYEYTYYIITQTRYFLLKLRWCIEKSFKITSKCTLITF